MRCSKCNSPLISGEPFCKICGTKIEDMPKEKTLEVIDFDDDEEFINDVIDNSDDLMDELDDVKTQTNISLEPVTLAEIENTPVDEDDSVVEPQELDINLEDDEKPEMSQTLIDIMMKPIDLEDTIKLESKNIDKDIEDLKALKEETPVEPAKEEIEEVVEEVEPEEVKEEEEPKPEVVEESHKEVFKADDKKKTLRKEIKSKEHDTTNRTVKTITPNSKGGSGLTVVILAIILIVSIILNIYLFASNDKEKPVVEDGGTTIVKKNKVVFGEHEISVDNGWTVSYLDNTLILADSSNEWMSKTFIVEDASYSDFIVNVEDFMEQMKEKKYQFTSNYEKTVDKSKLYLFKGKFESATTYLIVSSVDKNTLSVTELKFDNEVDDKTLEKVMNTINSIDVTNSEYEALDTETLSKLVQDNSIHIDDEDDDSTTKDKEKDKNKDKDKDEE